MNRIFYLSNLLDGDYFYERKELKFDLKRSVWNYFQFFVSLYSFLFHIIIFITDNEYLKHELPTLRMFEDVGERISNMAIGKLSRSRFIVCKNLKISTIKIFNFNPF